MSEERYKRAKEIFLAAKDMPSEERDRHLDSACGDDSSLRVLVESLLRHDEQPQSALREAAPSDSTAIWDRADSARAAEAGAALVGQRVGNFTIKRLIQSGGMGSVYLAVQEQPRRTVAVKVMRRGIASRSAMRRFEYESQILGRLRHPGIAQVYEAGTHDDGSGGVPYFAMEYIPNAKPITEYAESKKLGTRERLALLAKVCQAVHHGHQKGVIHRDLKPGNILVDSSGEPKVIDFGVARSTDSDLVTSGGTSRASRSRRGVRAWRTG